MSRIYRTIGISLLLGALPVVTMAGETPFLGVSGEQVVDDELSGRKYDRISRELDASGYQRSLDARQDPTAPTIRDTETAEGRTGQGAFWPSTIHQSRRNRETEGTGLSIFDRIFGN